MTAEIIPRITMTKYKSNSQLIKTNAQAISDIKDNFAGAICAPVLPACLTCLYWRVICGSRRQDEPRFTTVRFVSCRPAFLRLILEPSEQPLKQGTRDEQLRER
jgi:hypothetical protein